MAPVKENTRYIDVICQHCKNGKIIPLRLRVTDEDGELQTFTIKQYRDLTHYGDSTVSDYVVYQHNNRTFECKIQVFDTYKTIRIFFNGFEQRWRIL